MSGVLNVMTGQAGVGFTVKALPVLLLGTGFAPGSVVTSSSTTASTVGGEAPFTYLWSYVSGDTGFLIISPTSKSTKFTKYFSTTANQAALYKCTVTDSNGVIVDSNTVSVNLQGTLSEP